MRRAVSSFVAIAVVLPPLVAGVVLATYLVLPLPPALPNELPRPESQISTVLAADGTPIGQFRAAEQAIPIPADQIPDSLRRAVIAAEDHDFFAHGGIDYPAVARALVANLSARRIRQGGSTITQQLVKNLYTGGDRSVLRKVQEAVLAAQVERSMTKDAILARYLNTIYLGDSTFGVEAASRSYFGKPAREVTLSEAALLAGVIPAPSRFSPRSHPEVAEQRRQQVLDQMLHYGLATPEEVAQARGEIPQIHPPPGVEGRYPYFLDYVRRYLLEVRHLTPQQVYQGGLTIETSLDPRLQERAEEVVRTTLDAEHDPDAALVSLEPRTGLVRALVGGRNWDSNKVNLALGRLGGGTGRQAGSAFKPFVLARALEAGVKPSKRYSAPASIQPRGFTKPVSNYEGGSYGSADLRTATWKSINTVFVQLIVDVGIQETAETAQRLGITSIDLTKPIYGGIAIGTQEVSPLDMASAYGVFAARGLRAEPTPVVRVLDHNGNALLDNTDPHLDRVLPEVIADNVTDILKGVITSGTGRRADIGRPAAGKTGTSQNYENAWFVGYTPTLSTAVWMGFREGNITMRGVHGVRAVAGGTIPAGMWKAFMQSALKGVEPTEFTEPAPLDSLSELARRRQRHGFDPGTRRSPRGLPDEGPYFEPTPAPDALEPPLETTTSAPPTTTTTLPFVTTTTSGSLLGRD